MAIARVNGFAGAFENVSRNIQYYTVYAKSPGAFSNPTLATGVNIRVTGNYSDISQKCFEVLLQSIGLRAMPVLMSEPVAYARLEDQGAPTLCGEGFVWKFATEMPFVYENFSSKGTPGPVGLLIDELNGIVLPNSEILKTKSPGKNIEITRTELL